MTSCAEGRHTAFVIMPYQPPFQGVYDDLIRAALTNAGFEVTRAAEVTTSAAIMSTVIRGIKESCVIVADLTDGNPNVYYEMGIAHALHKPVIYLAQSIDELPFDIKAYRVIHYTRDYAMMKTAEKELTEVAKGVFDGSTLFGNPFSDQERRDVVPMCSEDPASDSRGGDDDRSPDPDEPPGILDHHATMEEGFEDLRKSTEAIGVETTKMSDKMRTIVDQINETQGDQGYRPDQARQQRTLVRLLAQEMNSYALFLSTENDNFSEATERTRPALEATLSAIEPTTDDDVEALHEFLSTLDEAEQPIVEFQQSSTEIASTIGELPDMERSFRRARDHVVAQLRRLAGNIEQIISMTARAREIAQAKLETQSGGS